MTVTELDRIDRTIDINATPERVFRALTNAAELGAWFQVTIEGELAAGKDVWMTSLHPGYVGQRFNVKIVEMTPPRSVTWQWHPGEIDATIDYSKEARTTVRFRLEPTATGTRVTVSETGFDAISLPRRAKVHKDNAQGWSEVVAWLQKYVENAR